MPSPGLAGLGQRQARQSRYEQVSSDRLRNRRQPLELSPEQRTTITEFAVTNYRDLLSDKQLRTQFAALCDGMALDWMRCFADAARRNGDNDQYLDFVGVLAMRECRATQSENGGVIQLGHLSEALGARPEEVELILNRLSGLGSGMDIVTLPRGLRVVRSIPVELGNEQGQVLVACDALGYVTAEILHANLGWQWERCQWALDGMVSSGLLWIDSQAVPTQYWTPAVL